MQYFTDFVADVLSSAGRVRACLEEMEALHIRIFYNDVRTAES
jgi:hypothetical protein